MTTLTKYGLKLIDNLKYSTTPRNISYFKNKAFEINELLQKKEKIPDVFIPCIYYNDNRTKTYTLKYYKYQIVICRQHQHSKSGRLYVNVRYRVIVINDTFKNVRALTNNSINGV